MGERLLRSTLLRPLTGKKSRVVAMMPEAYPVDCIASSLLHTLILTRAMMSHSMLITSSLESRNLLWCHLPILLHRTIRLVMYGIFLHRGRFLWHPCKTLGSDIPTLETRLDVVDLMLRWIFSKCCDYFVATVHDYSLGIWVYLLYSCYVTI